MTNHFRPGDGTIPRARTIRKQSTEPERRLWAALRRSQLNGYKFRRQQRLGPYFADFCCMQARLVIELDGSQHGEHLDAERTRYLQTQGWQVVRYWNNEVLLQTEAVVMAISNIASGLSLTPVPLPEGEGL